MKTVRRKVQPFQKNQPICPETHQTQDLIGSKRHTTPQILCPLLDKTKRWRTPDLLLHLPPSSSATGKQSLPLSTREPQPEQRNDR